MRIILEAKWHADQHISVHGYHIRNPKVYEIHKLLTASYDPLLRLVSRGRLILDQRRFYVN
jgi:hypothetical protein